MITNPRIDFAVLRGENKNVVFICCGCLFYHSRNENFDYLLEMHCTLYINPEGFINPELAHIKVCPEVTKSHPGLF